MQTNRNEKVFFPSSLLPSPPPSLPPHPRRERHRVIKAVHAQLSSSSSHCCSYASSSPSSLHPSSYPNSCRRSSNEEEAAPSCISLL